jgi:putative sigma-54 modulation protein
VKAHACAPEPEAALDLAVDKVGKQVARIKEKRVSRSHPRRRTSSVAGTNGDGDVDGELVLEPDDDDRGGGPRIVKTKRFAAKPMDPEEAALQMELLGHDFFLFTNTETGNAAVLYRRRDGQLGLIEATG